MNAGMNGGLTGLLSLAALQTFHKVLTFSWSCWLNFHFMVSPKFHVSQAKNGFFAVFAEKDQNSSNSQSEFQPPFGRGGARVLLRN